MRSATRQKRSDFPQETIPEDILAVARALAIMQARADHAAEIAQAPRVTDTKA